MDAGLRSYRSNCARLQGVRIRTLFVSICEKADSRGVFPPLRSERGVCCPLIAIEHFIEFRRRRRLPPVPSSLLF